MTDITPDTRRAENLRAALASAVAKLTKLIDDSRAADNGPMHIGTAAEDSIALAVSALNLAVEDYERLEQRERERNALAGSVEIK